MANIWKALNKPEYLYQPRTILRRLLEGGAASRNDWKVVQLPWMLPLAVNPSEAIGRIISRHGLYEMSVVEAIFRLTDPVDIFLDVGANIGYMTSAAAAAGAKKILSFEPHPTLFRELEHNVSLWTKARPKLANRISVRQEAVSDGRGMAKLRIPKLGFSANQGLSSLEISQDGGDYDEVEVATITFAQVFEQCGEPIGVLKIDIEGHEMTALNGSLPSFQAGTVRDIIFEDHYGLNSDLCRLFSKSGYTIFGLGKTLLGPVLLCSQADVTRFKSRSYESATNFLSTRNADRARQRMSARGFKCLAT
jgi:FkbM family methyltransferase